ncbi:MAG: hypothetical protein K9H64_21260 [Bacteroidales bacterium]|nr:hypothetical protein [Bacteroidales bacterium]MCF8458569.1 hypothetical protein [Bacteroidales bacterium]
MLTIRLCCQAVRAKVKFIRNSCLLVGLSINAFSQESDKTVTLTVSGQGATIDDAKQSALRNAIEQAFGAFISSKTEILNDELIKDEIVSISNGNIQDFEVISEVQLPSDEFAVTLKATVSVTKLTSFVESKGVNVEFRGSNFAVNIRQQKLNMESEFKAILSLAEVSKEILNNAIDYSLIIKEPVVSASYISHGTKINPKEDEYQIDIIVNCKPNDNYKLFIDYFMQTINNISLKQSEKDDYDAMKRPYYKIESGTSSFYLRNLNSLVVLQNLFIKSNDILLNFMVISDIDTIIVKKCCQDFEGHLTNNITKYQYKNPSEPNIWNLNFDGELSDLSGSPYNVSDNNNPGFPYVELYFVSSYKISTWYIYYQYIYWIKDQQQIFFNPLNYFTSTWKEMKKQNEKIPGESCVINLNFEKEIKYQHFIRRIYNTSELEKISNFNISTFN